MTEHLLIVWLATMVAAFVALIGPAGKEGGCRDAQPQSGHSLRRRWF
jgi:hypothetical protein